MGNVILGLLMLSPMTLYELNKQFEAGVSLFYAASLGSIRSAVLGLLDKELVSITESVDNGRQVVTLGGDRLNQTLTLRDVANDRHQKFFGFPDERRQADLDRDLVAVTVQCCEGKADTHRPARRFRQE